MVHRMPFGDGVLEYAVTGAERGRPLVFVHGSPGSWSAFAHLLSDEALAAEHRLISYDRPGFGQTQPGVQMPSLAAQGAALAGLLDWIGVTEPVVLLGHSLGGPVIARFAMDHPDRVAGLVFVAGSVDPEQERVTWYQHVADWRIMQGLIPAAMLTANREIRPLKGELTELLPRWSQIVAPTAVLQGEADRLVPPANADFLAAHLTGPLRIDRVPGAGHTILWTEVDRVRAAIAWVEAR